MMTMRSVLFLVGLVFLWLVACRRTEPPGTASFLQGDYAYVGLADRLHIVDVRDPTQPVTVSQVKIAEFNFERLGPAMALGDRVYAAIYDQNSGLRLYDVHEPRAPYAVGYHPASFVAGFQVRPPYLYLSGDGFQILNVARPAAIQALPPVQPLYGGDLALVEERLYLSSGGCGRGLNCSSQLVVLDLADPARPAILAELQPPDNELRRVLPVSDARLVYFSVLQPTTREQQLAFRLQAYERQALEAPGLAPERAWPPPALDIPVGGHVLYAEPDLVVATRPDGALELGHLAGGQVARRQTIRHLGDARQMARRDRYLYLLDTLFAYGDVQSQESVVLQIFDIGDPDAPTLVGVWRYDWSYPR